MSTALYHLVIEVEPGAEDAWNRWHEDVHIPEVLREPGFLTCEKWKDTEKAPDGWARYLCSYTMTGLDAVRAYTASDAAKRLRADSLSRFGTVTRISRQVLTGVKRFPGG